MASDDGECLGEVRGPAWAHFPHTPQATEFLARCVVSQFMLFPSIVHSGCAEVAHQSCLPLPDRNSKKRAYSGMMFQA
eukprot:1910922-Pyramimonas_sp.AAC.1